MSTSPWPDRCLGAVSLTFDDAIPSQLSEAAPVLTDRSLRATFYVNPNDEWRAHASPWRELHAGGHEIGNHTVSHPCAGSFGLTRGKPLEDMTLDEMEAEIRAGRDALREAIPEQSTCSFCYPCYQDSVGRGPSRQSYVPVVTRYHPAARGWGQCPNDPAFVDLHHVLAYPAEERRAADLIDLCDQALDGRWVVLVFHGIGEAHLPVATRHFRKLCRHLARRRERLWTAPLIEVAASIAQWQAVRNTEA